MTFAMGFSKTHYLAERLSSKLTHELLKFGFLDRILQIHLTWCVGFRLIRPGILHGHCMRNCASDANLHDTLVRLDKLDVFTASCNVLCHLTERKCQFFF